MWILIVLIVLLCLYLLALRGRRRHPGLARLRRWSYAHRGLHDETLPWKPGTASNWTCISPPTGI